MAVRELGEEELEGLKGGLLSPNAFTLRRCQILLSSSEGQTPQQIGARLYCSDNCVREAIHAFHAEGLACLHLKPRRPRADRLASLMANGEPIESNHTRWTLTVSEVARFLRVHPNSVRRWAETGIIPSYRIGSRGYRRFKLDEINSLRTSWQKQ